MVVVESFRAIVDRAHEKAINDRDEVIAWANSIEFDRDRVIATAHAEIEAKIWKTQFEKLTLKQQLTEGWAALYIEHATRVAKQGSFEAASQQALLDAQKA